MKRTVRPFVPSGSLRIQPSKSVLHRVLICASLARGTSVIENFASSEDISATMRALRSLGLAGFSVSGSRCDVFGDRQDPSELAVYCGESGSTLRFVLPLALDGMPHFLVGRGRLMQRPLEPYKRLCEKHDIVFHQGRDRIAVEGMLRNGVFELPGDVSSQFVSGLLMALPRLAGTSAIELTTALESAPYVDITRRVMEDFGVVTEAEGRRYTVPGPQLYQPRTYMAEGDYSHAAFFAVAAALGGSVEMSGLSQSSAQGDRAILDIVRSAGASVTSRTNSILVEHSQVSPFDIDVSQIPDLVPVLTVLACGAKGTSVIRGASRLRLKESDRLAAMTDVLSRLGVRVDEQEDMLTIYGTGSVNGGQVDSHADHRIAMSAAVASVISRGPITISGAEAVRKSAPLFFEQLEKIGGISV